MVELQPDALTTIALEAWREGRVAEAVGLARAAVRRLPGGSPEQRDQHPRLALAGMLIAIGAFAEADAALAGADAALAADAPDLAAADSIVLQLRRATLLLVTGRPVEAAIEAEGALAAARRWGRAMFVPPIAAVLARAALFLDDVTEADAWVARAHDAATLYSWPPLSPSLAWSEALVAGRTTGLGPLLDDPVAARCLFLDEPAAAAWVVRAGDAWEAEIATRTVERLAADSPGISSLTAAALHAGGLLRRDTNALEQAALRHTRPWDRASALEDLSVLCGPVPLTHALSAYEAAGSARDAARVRSRLASANGRQTRRESGPRRRALFGWNALTPNERAVADLVAEGLTNAEVGRKLCLSRHTVDFHLRQIFLKLGITSRVVLTRMVVDQDARSSAMNSPTP